MGSLITTLGSYVSLGLLAYAGTAHLRATQHLAYAIELQTGVRRQWARSIARAVGAAEVLLALVGFTAMMMGDRGPLRTTLVLAAALYSAYAIYSSFLVLRRPGVPCGCSSDELATTVWVVARAAALAVVAGAAALAPGRLLGWGLSTHLTVAILAAGTFILLLWNLPGALHSSVAEAPRAA